MTIGVWTWMAGTSPAMTGRAVPVHLTRLGPTRRAAPRDPRRARSRRRRRGGGNGARTWTRRARYRRRRHTRGSGAPARRRRPAYDGAIAGDRVSRTGRNGFARESGNYARGDRSLARRAQSDPAIRADGSAHALWDRRGTDRRRPCRDGALRTPADQRGRPPRQPARPAPGERAR